MESWKTVGNIGKHGIAIHNFCQDGPFRIKLQLGDAVNILESNGDWYFGYLVNHPSRMGIFPKSYVCCRETLACKKGWENELSSGIVKEITLVLREWNSIWKQLYVENSKDVDHVRSMIKDLISCRSKILLGICPMRQLMELKHCAASLIDIGNRSLGLDMVVRDGEGNILNANTTSTMKLFLEHELATGRIRQSLESTNKLSVGSITEIAEHNSHTLFISIMNFICIMEEDLELVLTLYDAERERPISENFVFLWKKHHHLNEYEKLKQMRVLFVDLEKKDLMISQIYLVCYIIRIDKTEEREAEYVESLPEQINSAVNVENSVRKIKPGCKRRPFGVSAFNLTSCLSTCAEDHEELHVFAPLIKYNEGDLQSLLKRLISLKEQAVEICLGQGLWLRLKLFCKDLREVIKLNNLKLENMLHAQKIGFPEVISPANVRNELYLTLIRGEFHRMLEPNKNIEVVTYVCGQDGKVISGVIKMGEHYFRAYRSVIYYRDNKPEWHETFRINMPLTGLKGCHLKFHFIHRSARFTSSKPFAISYVDINYEQGSTLRNGEHNLNVYKIDHSKYDYVRDSSYLRLPSRVADSEVEKYQIKGLTLCEKDKFNIHTYICSTKLTQNDNLQRLLSWESESHDLKEILEAFLEVDHAEIVNFLQGVLDSLFGILEMDFDVEENGCILVFCILHVLGVVLNDKYKTFRPIVCLYIQESYSATSYGKLIAILKDELIKAIYEQNFKLGIMRCIHYYVKFVIKSRKLFSEFHGEEGLKEFELSIKEILSLIMSLCCEPTSEWEVIRKSLKYAYPVFYDIQLAFVSEELSDTCCKQCYVLVKFINERHYKCKKENILLIKDIIWSKILLLPKCRVIITSAVLEILISYLENNEEVDLCIYTLSDMFECLHRLNFEFSPPKISQTLLSLLKSVINIAVKVDRRSAVSGKSVALTIEILRKLAPDNFKQCRNLFHSNERLLDFLMRILIFFGELISRPVYPRDWSEMILLQSSVLLKVFKSIADIMRVQFLQPFMEQIWNNYFHSAVAFITQPFLQLENFSEKKRMHISINYGDMRLTIGHEVNKMWFSLREYKRNFIPNLLGPFLELAAIPNMELQQTIIPIFFDMAQCEFYSLEDSIAHISPSAELMLFPKCNFFEVEKEIMMKIDILIESEKGDEFFKDYFYSILSNLFEEHGPMKEQGKRFMENIKLQLERLLQYRHCMKCDNVDNSMISVYQLLEFYNNTNCTEMFVRYVDKLCQMHLQFNNFAEAAMTLSLYAQLLDWSNDNISPVYKCDRYSACQTNFQLKETIFIQIIDYLDKGKMWHYALEFCKQLSQVYESVFYDYLKLACILRKMGDFYDNIMNKTFPQKEYFYVSYFGKELPTFLQNKEYIYQGNKYENLKEFCNRLQNQYPRAKLLNKLEENLKDSPHQYILVNQVFPVLDGNRYSNTSICEQILHHLRQCDVQKFRYPFPRSCEVENYLSEDPCIDEAENGGTSLNSDECFFRKWNTRTVLVTSECFPGCLKFSPVVSSFTFDRMPLMNIIEEIQTNNRSLFGILPFGNTDSLDLRYVGVMLNEIVNDSITGKLESEMKILLMENSKDWGLLKQLEHVLKEQADLIKIFVEKFGELTPGSWQNMLHRLERCIKSLTLFFDCESTAVLEDQITESAIKSEALVQCASFSRTRKPSTKKFLKSSSESFESFCEKKSKTLWYIPSSRSASDSNSFSSSDLLNVQNKKSVFYVPTPLSYILSSHSVPTSPPLSPSQENMSAFQLNTASFSENLRNEAMNYEGYDDVFTDELPAKSSKSVDYLNVPCNEFSMKSSDELPGMQIFNRPLPPLPVEAKECPPPLPPKRSKLAFLGANKPKK